MIYALGAFAAIAFYQGKTRLAWWLLGATFAIPLLVFLLWRKSKQNA